MKNECDYCGGEFEAARSTAKFCSGACRVKHCRGGSGKEVPQKVCLGPVTDKPWLSAGRLKAEPLVLERGLKVEELRAKLTRMKDYRNYQLRVGQPQHCLTVRELEVRLAKSGYDPGLAAGVRMELAPSPFLEKIKASVTG